MRKGLTPATALTLALCALAAPRAEAAAPCTPSPEANRQVVLQFYRQALTLRKPAEAFGRFVSADFVEHKPEVEKGTREATAAHLEGLIRSMPDPRWEVLRTAAEAYLVFLHARFTPAPGAPAYAIADVFRLKDCKIAEHWDVVAPPPKDQPNPNPRF
ncbi:MAG TPA: nuclear transport factor 2 family protein [Caulobacteraceae bacterium]|jgi:predicted SnoaL-like aldol condensation-catalyzing enzyme